MTFVDRTKDCIRRRGENISSFEVEAAVAALEGVAEVAAYAVPSVPAGTEDEVMLAVVPDPGASLDCAELVQRVDSVLPRFARPALRRARRRAAANAHGQGAQGGAPAPCGHTLRHGTGRPRQPT